jgi:hypothetical protein
MVLREATLILHMHGIVSTIKKAEILSIRDKKIIIL